MKATKNKKELQLSKKVILTWMIFFILVYFRKFVSFFTKYFPFSLLPDRLYIHHKNKELNSAWDFVRDETSKMGVFFDTKEVSNNCYFIYLTGIFLDRKKDKIEKVITKMKEILGESNFYAKQIDNKQFTFMIAKGSIEKANELGKIKPLFKI